MSLSKSLDVKEISFPIDIFYTDPNFYKPRKTDALLGADVFYQLLNPNQIKLRDESDCASGNRVWMDCKWFCEFK